MHTGHRFSLADSKADGVSHKLQRPFMCQLDDFFERGLDNPLLKASDEDSTVACPYPVTSPDLWVLFTA